MQTCYVCSASFYEEGLGEGEFGLCEDCIERMILDMARERKEKTDTYTCDLCGGIVFNKECFACNAKNPPQGNKKEVI